MVQDDLIGHHSGRLIVSGTCNVFDVAIIVDGFAVLIGRQIDREIDWLAANFTGYFWERVTTHKCLLWTVTSSVEQCETQS